MEVVVPASRGVIDLLNLMMGCVFLPIVDEAMGRMLSADPQKVEKQVEKAKEQKLLTAPTSKKLLPKPKK